MVPFPSFAITCALTLWPGELPENAKINETDTFGDQDDEGMGFEFDEDRDGDSDNDVDIDEI
jgi:hypothetical protein